MFNNKLKRAWSKNTYTIVCLFKRYVFSCFLKIFTLLTALRLSGREFHKNGAATEKALSPLVLADLISGELNNLDQSSEKNLKNHSYSAAEKSTLKFQSQYLLKY